MKRLCLTTLAILLVSASAVMTNLPANAKFDYQINGAYTPAADVRVVSRDRTNSPVPGLYNICYVNAFQTQPDEFARWNDTAAHRSLLLKRRDGTLFMDPGWPGEYLLNTSTAENRQALATIINGWIDECASKGFNAIEPDNLDTFTRVGGLLKQEDNVAYATLFTQHAHAAGLAVAQKNTAELEDEGKDTVGFDFAIAEECQFVTEDSDDGYDECAVYAHAYGNRILEIEYTDNDNAVQVFRDACAARGSAISVILRDRDVVVPTHSGYRYEEC